MHDYFSRLNTTKVLEFLAWNRARVLYYNSLEGKDIPAHDDPAFLSVNDKIQAIKTLEIDL